MYRLFIHVARALFITKGIEAPTEKDIFNSFIKYFISEGHISDSYKDLVALGVEKDLNGLVNHYNDVKNLLKAVKDLYQSMDNSLKFPRGKTIKEKTVAEPDGGSFLNVRKKDLRGVACPMNFVKTKIELAQINTGDLLEILLDDGESIENVPGSVEGEGHSVLSRDRTEDLYSRYRPSF
ncbi:MAG: sulfurtransferase TusA family protein [Spirochaetaceae bacterium]|nr:sulfurtransferase TusA family protein [Spirochaetaceae bacterium]